LQADLFSANVDFHDDLVRNIPGARKSQNLFDDLSSDPADWDVAIAAESAQRIPTAAALITRPFDYGSVISYTFDSSHWQTTRFSDGSLYGVWYGSPAVETTVYETAWHWYRFVLDSFAVEDREIVTERRVFDVRCEALLIDLRGKETAYPDLTSRTSYAFTHRVGTLRARAEPEWATGTFRAMRRHERVDLQAGAAVECARPDLSHLSPERRAGHVRCRTNAR